MLDGRGALSGMATPVAPLPRSKLAGICNCPLLVPPLGDSSLPPSSPSEEESEDSDEDAEEAADLFASVRVAQQSCRERGAEAFNIALKDGQSAGQPVPHTHVHVVPRVSGDLEENDLIYGMLDEWTPAGGKQDAPTLDVPADETRKPRTEDDMAREARSYFETAEAFPNGCATNGVTVKSGPLPTSHDDPVHFGKFKLDPRQVFYTSPSGLSLAIVNLKPLVPGHVLVVSKQRVAALADLDDAAYADLWRTTREVHALILKHYNATGANVAVQDGRHAGQSVPHVHVHLLPRS